MTPHQRPAFSRLVSRVLTGEAGTLSTSGSSWRARAKNRSPIAYTYTPTFPHTARYCCTRHTQAQRTSPLQPIRPPPASPAALSQGPPHHQRLFAPRSASAVSARARATSLARSSRSFKSSLSRLASSMSRSSRSFESSLARSSRSARAASQGPRSASRGWPPGPARLPSPRAP